MDWMNIAIAVVFAMMLPSAYRGAKWWLANGPKAQAGDWSTVLFILGLVILFVLLLIMSVQ